MRDSSLKGYSHRLEKIIQSLLDEFLEEYPDTPIQTIHMVLAKLARDYEAGESDESDDDLLT